MALLARVVAGGVRRRIRRPERWPSPTSIHCYHFDGLGSVIALTNSSGSVVNLYEYSVYGEVSASDPNHPNHFLFTGREFDADTGLYYYRARYYNPYIGRFLQTDPIGYGDGMNWYAYCGNGPVNGTDPSGQWASYTFKWIETGGGPRLMVKCWVDAAQTQLGTDFYFAGWNDLFHYVNGTGKYKSPGDFCDVDFDHCVFWSSLYAAEAADPTYGPSTRRIPTGTCQSGLSNAVDAVMSALPSDETLYTAGDVCTAVGMTAAVAATAGIAAGVATPALTAEGLMTLGAGATAGTTVITTSGVARTIGTYAEVYAAVRGTGLQVHHLIPQRFATLFNMNPRQVMSVALDRQTHQRLTNAWRNAIGYENSLNPLNTNMATREGVLQAARDIYQDYPELLRAIGL